jgi:hypothetical protein
MGVRYQTQAQGLLYTVVDDLQITYLALITSSLVDEVFGAPLLVQAVITPDLLGLGVNFTGGALFAVTGYVEVVFPKLATTPYTVKLNIVAPGYRPTSATVSVPVGSTFPIAVPPIPMRPLPVRLQGRVVNAVSRAPIGAATISSTDNTVLLVRSPLYFDHLSGVTVNAYTFPTVGAALNLAVPGTGGSSTVFLNNNAGLAGQTLQIGSGSDPLAEIVTVQSIGPAAGQANLQHNINSSFPANTSAQLVNPTPAAGSTTLKRSSNAGDGLLVLNGALPAQGVQIQDGAQSEYHHLNAITDGNGYYHANGIAGVPSLNLSASAGGPPATTSWFLVYQDPVNVVDFRL